MSRITRTSLARSDAIDIWRFIARDNEDAADRLIDEIEDRLKSLSKMPLAAEAVPFIGPDIRRSTVGSYVIYYRPTKAGIEVLRILHGAREAKDLL